MAGGWLRVAGKVECGMRKAKSGKKSQRPQRLCGRQMFYRRDAEDAEGWPRRSAALQRVEVWLDRCGKEDCSFTFTVTFTKTRRVD